MLGFARAGVVRFARQHGRPLSSAAVASSSGTNERQGKYMGGGGVRRGRGGYNNGHPSSRSSVNQSPEENKLMQKHREAIETNKLESLRDLADLIEWRGQISGRVLETAESLWKKEASTLSSLSDRQLSVLLSAYGSVAESTARQRKTTLLAHVVNVLKENKVVFGPLSRGALLSVRLDNGETVNAVEEMQEWDLAGIQMDSFAFAQLGRIYANEGNVKGIVEIIKHVKSEGLPVIPSLIESMIFALMKQGLYSDAEVAIKRFVTQPDQTELRLRCAAARAAASRGDVNAVVQQLAMVPAAEKMHQIENNKLVLAIVFQLLETGHNDAVEKLRPFLSMAEDGKTLSEWHNNGSVVMASRRVRGEGNLEAALRIYGMVHPNGRNSNAEEQFRSLLVNRVYARDTNVKELFEIAEMAKEIGIIQDVSTFLISRSIEAHPSRTRAIYEVCKERNTLDTALEGKTELKKALAKKLTEGMRNLELSQQSVLLSEAATILFHSKITHAESIDLYSTLFYLSGNDVTLPILTLPLLNDNRVKKEFGSAIVHGLLTRDTVAMDKFNKLMESSTLSSVSFSRIQHPLTRLINKEVKGEEGEKIMEMVAKVVALAFPDSSRQPTQYAAKAFIDFIKNEAITVEKVEKLVTLLGDDPRVGLSHDDLSDAKKTLPNDKYVLIEVLKRKSQAAARWREASVQSLEDELHHIQSGETPNGNVLSVIRYFIMRRLSIEKPLNIQSIEKHVRHVREATDSSKQLQQQADGLQMIAFKHVINNKELERAASLWELRGRNFPMADALTYSAHLYINNEKEKADSVLEDIRSSALTIKGFALDEVGSRLVDLPQQSIDEFAAMLKKKFNLGEKDTRKLVNKKKLKALNELIESNQLSDAFRLVADESNATGAAFGHFEMARAAIRKNETSLLRDVFNLIANHHSKNNAYLDTSFVLLEEGKTDAAIKMLQTPDLTITPRKLDFFISRAEKSQRPDVLRGLFTGLNGDNRASTVHLNNLLTVLIRLYHHSNDLSSLASLEEECRRTSFPLEAKTRKIFESVGKMSPEGTAV